MIVLDTNVVSELLRPEPDPNVRTWFDSQDDGEMFLTAVTEAELRFGVEIMPEGQRRERKMGAVESILSLGFQNRILPFDHGAAWEYAKVAAGLRAVGRPAHQYDGLIAAIARSHNAEMATRNVKHFEGCGLQVINPWNQ